MPRSLRLTFNVLVVGCVLLTASAVRLRTEAVSLPTSASESFTPPGDDVVVKFDYNHVEGGKNTIQKLTEKADLLLKSYGRKVETFRSAQEQLGEQVAIETMINGGLGDLATRKSELEALKSKATVSKDEAEEEAALAAVRSNAVMASLDKIKVEKDKANAQKLDLDEQLRVVAQETASVETEVEGEEESIREATDETEREMREMDQEAVQHRIDASQLTTEIATMESKIAETMQWIKECTAKKKIARKTSKKVKRAEAHQEKMDEFYKKQLSETHAKVQEAVKAIEAEEAKITEVLKRVAQKKVALIQAMNDQAAREGVMEDPEVQEEMADLEKTLEDIGKRQRSLQEKQAASARKATELMTQLEEGMALKGVPVPTSMAMRFIAAEVKKVGERLKADKCARDMKIQGLLMTKDADITGCSNPENCKGWQAHISKSIAGVTTLTKCMQEEFTLLCDLMDKMNEEIDKTQKSATDKLRSNKALYEQYDESRAANTRLRGEIESAIAKTEEAREEKKQTDAVIAENVKEVRAIESAVEKLKGMVEALNGELRTQKEAYERMHERLVEQRERLTKMRARIESIKTERREQAKAHAAEIRDLKDYIAGTLKPQLTSFQTQLQALVAELGLTGEEQQNCLNWKDEMNCERTEEPFTTKETCTAEPRQIVCKWRTEEPSGCRFTDFDRDLNANFGNDIISSIQNCVSATTEAYNSAELIETDLDMADVEDLIDAADAAQEKSQVSPELLRRSSVARAAVIADPSVTIKEEKDGKLDIEFPSLDPAVFKVRHFGCVDASKVCAKGKFDNKCVRDAVDRTGKTCGQSDVAQLECLSNDGGILESSRATLDTLKDFIVHAIEQAVDGVQCKVITEFYKKGGCTESEPRQCQSLPAKDTPHGFMRNSVLCRAEYIMKYLTETPRANGESVPAEVKERICAGASETFAPSLPTVQFKCGKNVCTE
eukprot:g2723.t1